MMFRNEHPDHRISVDLYTAKCSCGWKHGARTLFQAEHAAGQHYAETAVRGRRRPGEFSARCNIKTPRTLDTLDPDVLALVDADPTTTPERIVSRWDRKINANVVDLPCGFETTDRAAFEAHMREVHDRKPTTTPWPDQSTQSLARSVRRGWSNGLALKPEGKPFKASVKALAKVVKTCPHCGLIAEVDGTHGSVLWWDEHLRGCAILVEVGGAA